MRKIIWILLVGMMIFFVWIMKNSVQDEVEIGENDNSTLSSTDAFQLVIKGELDLDGLKTYHLPIIIDFCADWCPPCKQLKPIYEQLYKTYQGKAIIKYADVDEHPELSQVFPIQYIPTQTFFNSDGSPYAPQNAKELGLTFYYDESKNHILTMHVGVLTFEQMEQMLKEMGLNG